MNQNSVKDGFETIRGLGAEDLLSALGLARKRSVLGVLPPAAGIFVAGVALGTAVALLLAPKSGREVRRELKDRAHALTERLGISSDQIARGEQPATRHTDGVGAMFENGARPT